MDDGNYHLGLVGHLLALPPCLEQNASKARSKSRSSKATSRVHTRACPRGAKVPRSALARENCLACLQYSSETVFTFRRMFIDLNVPVPPASGLPAQQSKKGKGKQTQTQPVPAYTPAQIAAIEARIDLLEHCPFTYSLLRIDLPLNHSD